MTAKTNGKNKRVYGALEKVKENDRYNKKVRVGWTDNHRKKGKDETASDAGGEDGTGSWEAGTIYREICKASCHEAGHSKGGMGDEKIIGYRECDARWFVGVGNVPCTFGCLLAGVGCVGEYGYHEAAEVDAETLLGSHVCVLSNNGEDKTPCAKL